MVMAETAHPAPEKLDAFALGRLDDEASAEIEEHLTACEACRRLVEDTPADSLVETLQEPVPAVAAPPTESRPGLFTRLAAIVDPQAPKAAQPAAARSHQDVPAELRDHPRYEVLERLGAGGMGTVFKARHRLMDRMVALKVMNPQLMADPTAVGRFQREVKAAAQLAHPHIVTAYDAEQVGGLHFLAMEYVEGRTLAEVVDDRGPLPVDRACEYIRQAALGLQYAHERGTVHRDIKPQNLVLKPAGQVKVFDFGLARFVSESGEPGEGSSSGRMLGSPDYMAPEQAKEPHAADIRADIYSLGCTLYQLLTGLPPFAGGTPIEKLAAHLEKTPIEIAKLRLDVSADLERVVERMLAKDPQQRFQTPGEVATALEPFCKPSPAVAPVTQAAPTVRPQRRRTSLIAATALLLLLGGTGLFFAGSIYRFVTDQGTLVIETDDPDVEVVVKQGGQQITIVDTATQREVTLKAGNYQLELSGGKEGLKLSTNQFWLTRGGREIAKVWLEKKEPVVQAKAEPAPRKSSPVAFKASDEPPPLKDYLQGREILTVAQDGSGKYRSLNEAFQTLKAGQVIKVLDKGPYRERLDGPVPANVGIVSEVGTRIAIPEWKYRPKSSNPRVYDGWNFTNTDGLRISGVTIHCPEVPDSDEARSVHAVNIEGARGSLTIDWCHIQHPHGFDASDEHSLRPYGFCGLRLCCDPDTTVIASGNQIDGLIYLSSPLFSSVTLIRNHVVARVANAVAVLGRARQLVMSHNVVTHCQNATYFTALHRPVADKDDRPTALVSNNIFLATHGAIWCGRPTADSEWSLSPAVRIKNNLFIRPNVGISLDAKDVNVVSDFWQVGQNCYPTAPEASPVRFPRQPTDLLMPDVKFLSTNPADQNYFRIPAESPLATGGAGGDLPTYIGALPPGPAPKDGDWFTRLQIPSVSGSAVGLLEISQFLGHRQQVTGVAFSPDESHVLSGSHDKTVRLWDVARFKEVRRYEGSSAQIQSVAVSPDGKWVVAGGDGGLIQLWDIAAKSIRQFEGHKQTVASVAFSPDNRFLLSGSVDGTVRLWDVNTGKEQRRFPGHEGGVTCVDFSPDSRYVLSSGNDALVRLWDQETGQELRRVAGHTAPVTSVTFSPDGRLVLSASIDKTMRLWDAETGQQLRSFSHPSGVNRVAFSPDGRRVLSGSGERIGNTDVDGCVRLWDVASGQELGRFEGHRTAVESVAFSPDGRQAVSAGWDNTMRLLKLPESPSLPITEARSFAVPSPSGWLNLALSPDGRYALSSDAKDQSLRLWDVNTGQELRRFDGICEDSVLAFSPDGRLALSGSLRPDYSLRLWDVATGKEVRRFLGHTANLMRVAFTPDGRRVLSAGYDSTVRLWDAQTGRPLRVFQSPSAILRMDLSADGRLAVTGDSDNTVRLWDVATGRELRRLEGHTKAISGVAVSPDGRRILSAAEDKTIRLWDVEIGRQVRLFPVHPFAQSVAFSPDGRRAITGSWYSGATTRVWDIATGHELGRFDGGAVYCCAGTSILASADGRLRLLKLPPAEQELPSTVTGDAGKLAVESEATDGWLLVKQRDKVVLVLDATASQTVDLNVGEYQLELAGRTENLRLSVDKLTLAKGAKQVVQISRVSKPARVEITEFRSLAGHWGTHNLVHFSPDGRYLVSCSPDTTVRLWDVATGTEVRRFEGHMGALDCAVFSPDGQMVAGGGGYAYKDGKWQGSDFSVWLWNVATGRLIHRFEGHTGRVPGAAFSPNGQSLVTASWDCTVRLWDIPSKQPTQVLKGHGNGTGTAVAFSPDGSLVVSGVWDGTIRMWDAQDGRELHVLEGHGAQLETIAFSPDGSQVLSASADRTMRLWDAKTGRPQYTFPMQPGGVSAAFSPNGKRIISVSPVGSTGSRVRMWDVGTKEEIGFFDSPNRDLWRPDWSPDGRVVAGTGKNVRLLWISETGEPEKTARNPDLSQLVVETNGFDLPVIFMQPDKLVTVIVPKVSKVVELPPGDYELELVGQPEDFRLSADKVTLTKGQTQTVSIQEVPPAKPPYEITELHRFEGHTGGVESVAFSPDSRQFLSGGGDDKTVRLWDVETRKEVRRFEGSTQPVRSVAFSPDGRQAISSGWDTANSDFAIRLWEVDTGKELRRLTGHTGHIWRAAFSPDGSQIISCSQDRTVRLWDVKSGAELRQFTGHESDVRCVAFSSDGRRIVSGGYDATVRLWAADTGKEVRRFEGHTDVVCGVAFSPDGRQAVTAGRDGSLRLWDVETGRQLRSFSGCKTGQIAVAFSPDGRFILSGSGERPNRGGPAGFDYCVRLRDVATGEILGCFEGHRGPVVTVTFSPDGRTALAAGHDGTIRLLKLPEPGESRRTPSQEKK